MMNTKQCEAHAAYRYTWPGRDESFICEEHSQKLRAVANAMGLHLQMVPLRAGHDAEQCTQQVSKP